MSDKKYDIIGHQRQRDYLSRVASRPARHHMMIFVGPAHVGKAAIAHCFAHAYIARKDEEIHWTTLSQSVLHEDIILLAPHVKEEKGLVKVKRINVDQVRRTIKRARRTTRGGRRVLIVDDAHLMTRSAANALLKIIEEPPEGMYIIFVATDKSALLPTVLSRGMVVYFGLCEEDTSSKTPQLSSSVSSLAPGRPGLAYKLEDDISLRAQYEQALKDLKDIRTWSCAQRLHYAQDLSKDFAKVERFLEIWLMRTRHVAHEKGRYDVLLYSRRILATLTIIRTSNANVRMALENMLMHF